MYGNSTWLTRTRLRVRFQGEVPCSGRHGLGNSMRQLDQLAAYEEFGCVCGEMSLVTGLG